MSAVDVLAAREAHNAVIADAVRLLDDPEIRAAMDRHAGFSFDAATVHFRLLSTYVDFVKSDVAVSELVEAARLMADLMPDAELETDPVQGEIVARLRAALARVGGEA